ncbi:hem peroxidase, partial [Dillenia turbinata]
GDLQLNCYADGCPRAEETVKDEVSKLHEKHGNTSISWASLLLDATEDMESEKASGRSFGMRFQYINTIKQALESECPNTVSCADMVALSARDGIDHMLKWKPGRRDSKQSYRAAVEELIPNHKDSISSLLSRFQSVGIDMEGVVTLLGRTHCLNLVNRLNPIVDPPSTPLRRVPKKGRCPTPQSDPNKVKFAKNDKVTRMNLLNHKGLLLIDQQLTSHPTTSTLWKKRASDNDYFREQFCRAILLLSDNNPLTNDEGEIR